MRSSFFRGGFGRRRGDGAQIFVLQVFEVADEVLFGLFELFAPAAEGLAVCLVHLAERCRGARRTPSLIRGGR